MAVSRSLVPWIGAWVALCLCLATPAQACSVCFGDADSPMGRGAAAGVWTLAAIAAFVLTGVAGMGLFFVYRSRHLGSEVDSFSE